MNLFYQRAHFGLLIAGALGLPALAASGAPAAEPPPANWQRPGENIALGKPYTLSPAPNYSLCRDADDKVQLTDGQYVTGYFWTQPGTVGWQNTSLARVVIDLGKDEPIGGLSVHTAAGRANVGWPQSLALFVSDDGKTWWDAGDLVALSALKAPPPADEYTTWRFWSDELATHGRYVAVALAPNGQYTFCDEIEIYRGQPALLGKAHAGRPADSLDAAVHARRYRGDVQREADALSRRLQQSKLPNGQKTRLAGLLQQAAAGIATMPGLAQSDRALWPYGETHRKVLAVQAEMWRAERRPALQAWTGSPWEPLSPYDAPPAGVPARLDVATMRGETRGVVLNLTNAGEQDARVAVTFAGLPGAPRPEWIQVRQTTFTAVKGDTLLSKPEFQDRPRVAGSALPEASQGTVTVPAGATGQVWLSINTTSVPAGDYNGQVLLSGAQPAAVPLRLHVSKLTMPKDLSLALGGWDYTDAPGRGITKENLDAVVSFLQAYHVNAPWATSSVMPFGKHDDTGKMLEPPDTTRLDAWIARWPKACYYCVFNSFREPIEEMPGGKQRVAEWITFYVQHLKEKGIKPSQLLLLPVDEPNKEAEDKQIVGYARAIHEAAPEVVVFEDPTWQDPRKASPEMLALSGMLCPNRPMWLKDRQTFEEVYLRERDAGRRLAFYSCSGPVRALDPYSYHRLQAWDAFRYGATYEAFWAFGDNGGGSAWNEDAIPGTCFSPQMLDAEGCTTAKHMEGVREGLYDYEYLVMLRQAVDKATKAGRADAAVQRARALLEAAPARVVDAPGNNSIDWLTPKDRSAADQVRVEILQALEALG